jgi:hypothetical protein
MTRLWLIARMSRAPLVASCALLAGCLGSFHATPQSLTPTETTQSAIGTTPANRVVARKRLGWLYQSDFYHLIWRFPIKANGKLGLASWVNIPGTGPSPRGPSALAFGTPNDLFALGSIGNFIRVYRPERSRWVLRRRLDVWRERGRIAVDANGYLYVGSIHKHPAIVVNVFAPGAKGDAKPLLTIPLPNGATAVRGMAIDPTGNLYVSTDANEVDEYASPETSPTLTRTLKGNAQMLTPWSLAFDPTGELYVANTGFNNVLAYSPTANGNAPADRAISSTSSPPLAGIVGIAVSDETLYVLGLPPAAFSQIWVLDATRGAQPANQVVGACSGCLDPVDLAVGP